MKKTLRIARYSLLVLLLLFILLFKPASKSKEYSQSRLYNKTKAQFSALQLQNDFSASDTIQAGWHKMNITPTRPEKLAGYGLRGDYTEVEDSLFVRTLVFKNNQHTIAYISYDLILVSKDLANAVRKKLRNSDLDVSDIYFSAIHSHSSFGGWSKAKGMQVLYGKYDKKMVNEIAEKTIQNIENAMLKAEKISFGYGELPLNRTVRNHFGKEFHTDSILRVVKIKNVSGKTAFITSFSAHGTYLHPEYTKLSGDYPGLLNLLIEENDSNYFSIFSAGAVACHRLYLKYPTRDSTYSYRSQKDTKSYANFLAKQVLKINYKTPIESSNILDYKNIPVPVSTPQARIGKNISFRAWVIYLLAGKPKPYITYFRLGNIVFIGNPCDISGEFYPEFDSILQQKSIHLMLTSFNGEYMGYVIPDHHYDMKESEAREMNWYSAGSHFVFMIKSILNKIE